MKVDAGLGNLFPPITSSSNLSKSATLFSTGNLSGQINNTLSNVISLGQNSQSLRQTDGTATQPSGQSSGQSSATTTQASTYPPNQSTADVKRALYSQQANFLASQAALFYSGISQLLADSTPIKSTTIAPVSSQPISTVSTKTKQNSGYQIQTTKSDNLLATNANKYTENNNFFKSNASKPAVNIKA